MARRAMPLQYSQMRRPASHHAIKSDVTKLPRPERNGRVYSDTIVLQVPATSRNAGITSPAPARIITRGCWPANQLSIIPCHSGIQRSGAASTVIVPRHSAGKRATSDSNMETLASDRWVQCSRATHYYASAPPASAATRQLQEGRTMQHFVAVMRRCSASRDCALGHDGERSLPRWAMCISIEWRRGLLQKKRASARGIWRELTEGATLIYSVSSMS